MLIFRLSSPGSRANVGQQVLRLDEQIGAEEVVEAAHDLARELEVRDLVLADRHVPRVVHRDVGGLQERIAEEANRRQIAIREVLLLLLVSRHALEPRDGTTIDSSR